jgi:chromate transport protein ChrA
MDVLIAWLLVLVPAAIALWCFAAFVLHAGAAVRVLVATLVPAVAVACLFFAQYWSSRTPPAEPGWDIFFAIFCIISGATTTLVTLPVAWIAERRFGSYAP